MARTRQASTLRPKQYPNPVWTGGNGRQTIQSVSNLHLINIRRWIDTAGKALSEGYIGLFGEPYQKDGYTLEEWRDFVDNEIARRVIAKSEDMPLCL